MNSRGDDGGRAEAEDLAVVVGPAPEELSAVEAPNGASEKELDLFQNASSEEAWKEDAKKREHERTQRFRDGFEGILIGTVRIIAVSFWALGLFWVLNLILGPVRWLSPEDMRHIQDILTGGILLGVISEHIKRRMG